MFWILEQEGSFAEGAGEGPEGAKLFECEEKWAKEVDALQQKLVKEEQ